MDSKALEDSEIFQEYFKKEAAKLATIKSPQEDLQHIVSAFEEFESTVRSSPKKLQVFRALQEKFASDPVYTAGVNLGFVDAVMLLNLDEVK